MIMQDAVIHANGNILLNMLVQYFKNVILHSTYSTTTTTCNTTTSVDFGNNMHVK